VSGLGVIGRPDTCCRSAGLLKMEHPVTRGVR